LLFGTAGIRAHMGAGSSNFNYVTIIKITTALANYFKTKRSNSKIIVAHDNRRNSSYFANIIATILTKHCITTYVFAKNDIQPTPVLVFSIKNLSLDGGIMITGSHNS